MTIPKFRELLAHFQAQAESYLDHGGPTATTETGFIKRRDHLAELESVRGQAAATIETLERQVREHAATIDIVRVQRDAAKRLLASRTEELELARTKVKSLSGKLGHANARAVWAEARLIEHEIELKPAKIPAKFRKKFDETWGDRLRARANRPEQ